MIESEEERKMRQKRLMEVFGHLQSGPYGIHYKYHLAKALGYGRTSISAAMGGDPDYLTKDLFEAICKKYPGVFNLEYLLYGIGELLTPEEKARINGTAPSQQDEQFASDDPLVLYSRMIRSVDDLRMQIKDELDDLRAVKSELQQSRDEFREATHRLMQAVSRLESSRSSSSYIAADGDY